ncbi:MAG: hypothetical protein AB7T63_10460 [Planctomycetota bacterium]
MSRCLLVGLLGVTLLVALGARTAHAERWPTLPLDVLTDDATLVVVARVVDPLPSVRGVKQTEWHTLGAHVEVIEILKGNGVAVGERLFIQGLWTYVVPKLGPPEARRPAFDLTDGLLFLRRSWPASGEPTYAPLMSGVRMRTQDGRVLRPIQEMSSAPYMLRVADGPAWPDLLQWVRDDVQRIAGLRALFRIDLQPARNMLLLDWLERHADLVASTRLRLDHTQADRPGGFGRAPLDAAGLIIQSGPVDDAWAAIRRLNHGVARLWDWVDPDPPVFRSAEGRSLLVGVARDASRPPAERVFALGILGSSATLTDSGVAAVPDAEVTFLVAALDEVLADPLVPPEVADAARNVRPRVLGSEGSGRPQPDTVRAWAIYHRVPRSASDYVERNGAAVDLHTYLGETAWKQLTGNPRRLLITMYLYPPDQGLRMSVQLHTPGQPIFERPTLVLERVDVDGVVLRRLRRSLPECEQEFAWAHGWTAWGRQPRSAVPTEDLVPGAWRVTLEGTSGGDRVPWRSEPQGFVWPPRQPPR